jgi:hypothetical protein
VTWSRDQDTLSHDSGFVIIFERFSHRFASKPWNPKSVVVEYGEHFWRGTMTKTVRKDRTGVDEMRLLREAHDEWLRHLRASNDPFPE